jgi:general secretion pathway protein J
MLMIARSDAQARGREAGFTLLELLVALVVFGLLAIGLYSGVRTATEALRHQSSRIGVTAELDAITRTLRTLLGGLPVAPAPGNDPNASPRPIAFLGTADRLAFIGDLPTGVGGKARAEATLAVVGDQLVLAWRPHRHEAEGARPKLVETVLLQNVARLSLAYWGPSPEGTGNWLAQWGGAALPALIRVRLSFAAGDQRRWPDMIVAPILWAPPSWHWSYPGSLRRQ